MSLSADGVGRATSPVTGFNRLERRAVAGLTALFGLRMLGIYLVIPVFAPYAATLSESTPLLVGLSVGVYGLTQTLFQVPFGAMSDRLGRKPVLTLGLAVFAAGSIVCALATNAWVLVAGRLIQGMGAMASVAVAMLADLTRDQVRTRAMAMLGVAIGGAFASGLLFGPWVTARYGVPSLFWLTAALTGVGILYLWIFIPEPPRLTHHEDAEYSQEHVFEVVTNPNLLRLDLGTFNLHVVLTSIFVVGPFLLTGFIELTDYWKVFLPIMSIGFAVMLGGARIAERPGRGKKVALFGQVMMIVSLIVMAFTAPASVYQRGAGLTVLCLGLLLFVCSFALLEPLLPALLTRLTQQTNRGTAVGIFNMSQFSGAFVGGLIAGTFLERDVEALFWILAGMSFLWLIAALRLEDPKQLDTFKLSLAGIGPEEKRGAVRSLLRLRGVEDVAWDRSHNRLMIRYASDDLDPTSIRNAVSPHLTAPSAPS